MFFFTFPVQASVERVFSVITLGVNKKYFSAFSDASIISQTPSIVLVSFALK